MVVTVLNDHSVYDIFQTCVCWVATIDVALISKMWPKNHGMKADVWITIHRVLACCRWLRWRFYFLLFKLFALFFCSSDLINWKKNVKISLKHYFLHEEVKYLFPVQINPTFPYLTMIWCSLICIFAPVTYKEFFFNKTIIWNRFKCNLRA